MTALRDPETCRICQARGRVVNSRRSSLGYRRRRHECPICLRRWTSWQSLISPRKVTLKTATYNL